MLEFENGQTFFKKCRKPATTSSPWASRRNSPYRWFSPVDGLREKRTPVPEVGPRLPKTMACTRRSSVKRHPSIGVKRPTYTT